jgi:Transposase DDE domain
MHAQHIVQGFIQTHLVGMHAARRKVLAQAVGAIVTGHFLSLTRIARALSGAVKLKAALKRVDRLIGHGRIEQEARLVGSRLLEQLSRVSCPLVILVDWSPVNPGGSFVELRAAVSYPGMGRALTVYQQVYPQRQLGSGKLESALLEQLHRWLGGRGQVIVVSDAGFRRSWFAHVERLGWDWVGRVRRGVMLAACEPTGASPGQWLELGSWFTRASGRAKRFANCWLSKRGCWPCQVVLVRRRPCARKHYRCPGYGSPTRARHEARQSAKEPWLLVHSAALSAYLPEQIVAFYAARMQIEECFRDNKSLRFGMGQELGRSRSALRLHALLLIATLASFLMWHIGQLAEAEGLHRHFKATTRLRRELSLISLARLICSLPPLHLSQFAVHALYERLSIRQ